MSWFYVENGASRGPIEDETFERFVQGGTIRPDTLVWREGMAEWLPHARVLDPSAALPAGATATAVATAAPSADAARCAECGGVFERRDMVAYNGVFVCAGCRDVFFQKVREGLIVPEAQPLTGSFAGFWIRFLAIFIDGIILWVVGTVLQIPLSVFLAPEFSEHSFDHGPFPAELLIFYGVLIVVNLGVSFGYKTFFVGRMGATPGKLALNLRIVRTDGSKVTYMRAFGRAAAEIVSGLTLYIGYIIAGFDEQKRALHDHICDTRVIKKT